MSDVIDIKLSAEQLEGTSATLTKWLVPLGSHVEDGEPVIELETDKVSMEVCAPATGVLSEILINVGQGVSVDALLGRMSVKDKETSAELADLSLSGAVEPLHTQSPVESSVESLVESSVEKSVNQVDEQSVDASGRQLIGPAVRRLLAQHDLDIQLIPGTGKRGRVTRDDVRRYLDQMSSPVLSIDNTKHNLAAPLHQVSQTASQITALQGVRVPHTTMRKAIADHMVSSLLHTAPHVTSVFEMDMSNLIAHRKWHKKEYEQLAVKLTFTAYFLMAMAEAVKEVPQVNARFHEDALEIFSDVNIGVGTALGDGGLIVPVVPQVNNLSLFEVASKLTEQTRKARESKLLPADMKNGTITISNHGVSGSLLAAPIIINQPEVAILGVGKLEKRVVVVEENGVDKMVIKPMCYVSLSIDHRALDAHQTNRFLSAFVKIIETWGE